ncbi:unnamed protein product [Cladocopium goreaui]|uniref:Translation elongation factor 1 alpha-like protein n=1 Tax=Cladocopium goreaui TaxID=2562237 RepID=A0A9P1G6B7_9DINO|nr:unnamed protein product [Cladocopium goreaui]
MSLEERPHLSVAICGHVGSGKSTIGAQLLNSLRPPVRRGLLTPPRRVEGAADVQIFLDTRPEEREMGRTVICKMKEFVTEHWRYTLIDVPGHQRYITNMIAGASLADAALLLVPADDTFAWSLCSAGGGVPEGGSRQHARVLHTFGVTQLCIVVTKLDGLAPAEQPARFREVVQETKRSLRKSGWKSDFLEQNVAFVPEAGHRNFNITSRSDYFPWWTGQDVQLPEARGSALVHIHCLYDVLDAIFAPPMRCINAPLLMTVLHVVPVYRCLVGRVEQGTLRHWKVKDERTVVLPRSLDGIFGYPAPQRGQALMLLEEEERYGELRSFEAQVVLLFSPSDMKLGHVALACVCTGRAPVRLLDIKWKISKETGGRKVEGPQKLRPNDMALCTFQPLKPFLCDSFGSCSKLARILFVEHHQVMMLGKVVCCHRKEDNDKGGKKK